MEHHDSFLTTWLSGLFGVHLSDMVVMASLVGLVLLTIAVLGTRRLSVEAPGGFQQTLEVVVGGFTSFAESIIPHHARRHVPVMLTFALLIFMGNFFGLIPKLSSPSTSYAYTLGLALVSFLYYNAVSFKENGIMGHLKHLWGPVALIGPLFFLIELISHGARVLSLSLRLFGNISGEHAAKNVFYDLLPYLVPLPMHLLGLFGSLLQTFIFVLLSMVYIALMQDH